MGKREVEAGCCAPGETPLSYEESVELGNRRRSLVLRFSAAASALLCLAAFAALAIGGPAAGEAASNRLAWAAALFGGPMLLGYARQLLDTRRMSWQLTVAVVLLAAAALGYPMVAAVVVAATLAMRALRPAKPQIEACEPDCAQACCQAATAGAGVTDTARRER